MGVTINLVGATCDVTIVDENFKNLQELFQSGVLNPDILGRITRYQVTRYAGGRMVSTRTFANPFLVDALSAKDGIFDLTYRHSTELVWSDAIEEATRSAYAMELLGKPGGSFYFQWQEDGFSEATINSYGMTGWPPPYWPISRYPKDLCFSKWLTPPHAAIHQYVEEPCVAKVKMTTKGSHNLLRQLDTLHITSRDGTALVDNFNWRGRHLGRFGLIVDTNPVLYEDEFENTNPNIVDPITGLQSDFCTWKVLRDRTFFLPQRAQVTLVAEVALKGGRYYNFRAAFRDAAHHGAVDRTALAWYPGNWESMSGVVNSPVFSPTWTGLLTTKFTVAVDPGKAFYPPWINLWENCSICVDFKYGRSVAYTTDYDANDLNIRP